MLLFIPNAVLVLWPGHWLPEGGDEGFPARLNLSILIANGYDQSSGNNTNINTNSCWCKLNTVMRINIMISL